ncbi:hypothetical protein ACFP3Q_04840 [Nocardioides sp. GCM10027113]|uniref:hypothetical protein n=1 Tax=unclassified Nocardioides TaxID=2615069 RepID=UPI003617D197
MDEVTWGALTLTLTLLLAAWTWVAFRRRGIASGLRSAGLTLLPPAAWMTGTMEMFTEIGGSVADWATGLVLSPRVWIGIALAGTAVMLLLVSGVLRERGVGGRAVKGGDGEPRAAKGRKDKQLPKAAGPGKPALDDDDDMADIEAILRKRGIT